MIKVKMFVISLFLIVGCSPVKNNLVLQNKNCEYFQGEPTFNLNDAGIYSMRIKRKVLLEIPSLDSSKSKDYSDTPYPVYINMSEISDTSHVVEENYIILLDEGKKIRSGRLLFFSTYYIKEESIQDACFNNLDYFTAYGIQNIELGTWTKEKTSEIRLEIFRKSETLIFWGTHHNDKLSLEETLHPKLNISARSTFVNEQPRIQIKEIMNLQGHEGLIFLNTTNRKFIAEKWNEIPKKRKKIGEHLTEEFNDISDLQGYNYITLNLDDKRKRKRQLGFSVDTVSNCLLTYRKKLYFPKARQLSNRK